MRLKTITTELYTFEELSERAKEAAINELRYINVDYDWWQYIYDDAETVGIEILAFDLDRARHAKTKICNPQETAELILKNHVVDCETYKTSKQFLAEVRPLQEKFGRVEAIQDKFHASTRLNVLSANLEGIIEDLEGDFRRSITEDYSIMLQKGYEYVTSKDTIIEAILANEYEFTVEGKLS